MYILAGALKGRKIQCPKTKETRPVTSLLRKSLFDTCQFYISGARVLDAFAGSGAIGLEALSRGAGSVHFIDLHPIAIRCIRSNLEAMHQTATVLQMDAFRFFETYEGPPFDILFLDPPYPIGQNGYLHLIDLLKTTKAASPTSHIFLEAPSQFSLPLHKKRSSSTTTLYTVTV